MSTAGLFSSAQHDLEDYTASLPTSERVALKFTLCLPGASRPHGSWSRLSRFLGRQLFYLAIAVVIYGIFWAIRPENTNLANTLVYTFCLCNLTMLALENLTFLYFQRRPLYFWLVYLALLLALTPVMVTITTAIVFWLMDRPGGSFWNYLGSGWKFPSIATITFGIACQI